MSKNRKIALIAGGGTGGHLFPALSIGKELQKNKIDVQYIGSKYGIEKQIFENSNLNYHLLNITGIKRDFSFKSLYLNFLFPFRFVLSYLKSLFIINSIKPSIIIGTGGYASGLPLIAGIHLNIPTVIQDQNSVPGLITRTLHNKTTRIYLAYKVAKEKLNKRKCIVTGNPMKSELVKYNKAKALRELNLNKTKKTILILGGSQGASPLNNHFTKNIEFYLNNDIQIIWQCGYKDYKYLLNKDYNHNIVIKPFINNMSQIYSASDIVIARAGAISISELCYMSKAMILIPYPYASDNHQSLNAKNMFKNNACITINQTDLTNNSLENTIMNLFNNKKKIATLEKNAKLFSNPNATKDITKNILEIIS